MIRNIPVSCILISTATRLSIMSEPMQPSADSIEEGPSQPAPKRTEVSKAPNDDDWQIVTEEDGKPPRFCGTLVTAQGDFSFGKGKKKRTLFAYQVGYANGHTHWSDDEGEAGEVKQEKKGDVGEKEGHGVDKAEKDPEKVDDGNQNPPTPNNEL
ncbi:hypothetical protein CEP51_011543 [Fusarium floridanum]|uniref:Uncharacterized protein n=1 Tax=Fusarium floridanum TaxID=1325733 RepID=A0A428RAD6_9HYPO|nr:hypothetical protein CEP51_011543 [Fusarium floridanum]